MNVLEFKKKITPAFRKRLAFNALIAPYVEYISLKGTRVGLEWAYADHIDASEITDRIPFTPTGLRFTRFLAGNFIAPHVDDSKTRTSCLSVALLPSLENFAPVIYHNKLGSDAVVTQTYHYNLHPVILNTANVHSMYNNVYDRYIFQIQYQEPIEMFIEYAQKS